MVDAVSRRGVFAAAVLLMPLTYGTKFALGIQSMTWVDPTLVLGFLLFLSFADRRIVRPPSSLLLLLASFGCAILGYLWLPTGGSLGNALYSVVREPLRLALNLMWFWVTVRFFAKQRSWTVRWLATSVALQLGVALYLWLGAFHVLPLAEPVRTYVREYAVRQAVWIGGLPIPRLGGTFIESPPFGLFMFAGFTVLFLERYLRHNRDGWVLAGLLASLAGCIGSLSDQVLLAMAIFGSGLLVVQMGRRGHRRPAVLALLVLLPVCGYAAFRLEQKTQQVVIQGSAVYGTSGGERAFHTRYALHTLAKRPAALLAGLGPGRYGAYAARTLIFPPSVTPQVLPIEWLAGFGVLGTALVLLWLSAIAREAIRSLGWVGLAAILGLLMADMFQAEWKWEAWFLALAYLFAEGLSRVSLPAAAAVRTEDTPRSGRA